MFKLSKAIQPIKQMIDCMKGNHQYGQWQPIYMERVLEPCMNVGITQKRHCKCCGSIEFSM